jgi:hypothetical protein|tara:strand:+ start:576 stop:773 length:198 start_codon:yes stop_codon:yes gene_type:complete
MKPGDLVRIKKSAVDAYSTLWFIELAEQKTPLLITENLNKGYVKVLKPDGTDTFIAKVNLTTRLY